MSRRFLRVLLSGCVVLPLLAQPMSGRSEKMIAEKIEWTWEVTPDHLQPDLPNVLLLGDSITRNYFPDVTQDLAGKANVYLFSSSICVGDPRLVAELKQFFVMEHTHFRVIHFNNGMHGWGFTEAEYKDGFPALVRELRTAQPGAKLIWANTTPVRKDDPDGATNARVAARNEIADAIVKQDHIPLDDQFEVIHQHPDMYDGDVHPNKEASALQGRQAADMIEKLL
jgi:hypothetical protein